MIDVIERALMAWGEEYRTRGAVASLPCTLGVAMDNHGVLIRGTASQNGVPLYCGELGPVGHAVEAALVSIRQPRDIGGLGQVGIELVRLARVRYLSDPMPLVEHQMKRMGWRSRETHRSKVHQLHQALQPLLNESLPWMKRAC